MENTVIETGPYGTAEIRRTGDGTYTVNLIGDATVLRTRRTLGLARSALRAVEASYGRPVERTRVTVI